MTLSQTIDVQVMPSTGVSPQAKAFAAENLGPMPGQWNGYDDLDETIQRAVWSKVGHVHALSAEAGRNIVAVGQTLIEMKELLPHGQFMDCVSAEFGWTQRWSNQLMGVAERFSNWKSTSTLPSSAQVLALLASHDADDSMVQQAAEERWTVKETRKRLGSEKQRERSLIDEAMSVLKLSSEARQLADKAEHISTRQLMDELGLQEPPKGRTHTNQFFTFCKNGCGWWKLPIAQPVEVEHAKVEPVVETLSLAVAAQRIGKKFGTLRNRLTPGSIAKLGYISGNGWQAEPSPARGMCIVRKLCNVLEG
jgi:hypothetical protein